MATAYSATPSSLLGLAPGSWGAYSLDRAVLNLGEQVDAAIARARNSKGSPEQVGKRVGRAIDRVLLSEDELAAKRVRRPERSPEELARLRAMVLTMPGQEVRRGD